MDKHNRPIEIIKAIKKIEDSPLSVNQYFKENDLPFTYSAYYNYKKIIKEEGLEGLFDKRSQGNNLKFTDGIKNYMRGFLENKQNVTSLEIADKIKKEFNVDISVRSINRFRQENNLSLTRLPKVESSWNESGASEVVVALSFETGLIDVISDFIYQFVQNKKKTNEFFQSAFIKKEHVNYRSNGKFTGKYNQLSEVRENRFKSLEEKVNTKKFDSMEVFKLSKESIKRYCIALLSLPIVTSNGKIRSVNSVKGNDLKFLCGFNYRAGTLDKHIRELKYLQLSSELIEVIAKFWLNFWKRRNKSNSIFACYYIDGNTKALWSWKSCYKGKVTMHGRVMNCIEQLFIHDGQGHPIYFKTFNGHADLGKNGLKLLEKITDHLNEEKDQFSVNRILIMDGGGNAVSVLREIIDYYYITILDSNQINDRKFKFISKEMRYEYGHGYLIDCKIELKDSNDGYILEPRAVQIRWDNGRTCTLVTNLPTDLFSADNVVKSYFDRWPKQELDFKDMKNGVNIHRMVGYGKKLVDNPKVIEKINLLQRQIKEIENKLSIPLREINDLEKELQSLIKAETRYREKSKILEGKRQFKDENDEQDFKTIEKQITQITNQIKKIKKNYGNFFSRLKKKKDELARIIDKKKRYHVDVELDQLMTCFKLSFANICNYLLEECFEGKKMSLQSLFDSIFDLRGKVKEEEDQRKILIEENPKQLDFMKDLADGFEAINKMKAKNIRGYVYNFSFV